MLSYDPYLERRWHDKINPEQTQAVYCAIYDREVAEDSKTIALDDRYISRRTKKHTARYGDIHDTNKTTRSAKNKLEVLEV